MAKFPSILQNFISFVLHFLSLISGFSTLKFVLVFSHHWQRFNEIKLNVLHGFSQFFLNLGTQCEVFITCFIVFTGQILIHSFSFSCFKVITDFQ